jgi:dihydrofolate reductase
VFTHHELPPLPGVDVRFVSGDVRQAHAEMDAVGGDSWIVGGGDLVGQFDDAGLLDEVHLGVCPVTLGAGAPLLPRRIASDRMTLRSVRQDGQRARLVLDVTRRPD